MSNGTVGPLNENVSGGRLHRPAHLMPQKLTSGGQVPAPVRSGAQRAGTPHAYWVPRHAYDELQWVFLPGAVL